jgi:hypothetical protein
VFDAPSALTETVAVYTPAARLSVVACSVSVLGAVALLRVAASDDGKRTVDDEAEGGAELSNRMGHGRVPFRASSG